MVTVLEDLLDDLRDFMHDETDTEVTATRKTRYLNRGLRAMYPKVFQVVVDASVPLVDDDFEYSIPLTSGTEYMISVEVETGLATGRFMPCHGYSVLFAATGSIIRFDTVNLPSSAGALLRFRMAAPLTEFDWSEPIDDEQVYGGPPGTEELPLLYAMGLAAGRRVDARLDYTRFSTTQAVNGVSENDLLGAAQAWFTQFELLLDRWTMPMPWVPV